MIFRIECLTIAVVAQYDYGNLATFSGRSYNYDDGEYQALGPVNGGSGDDAGLGFGGAFYDDNYDSAGDGSYDATFFEFPDENTSFDDMMETVQTNDDSTEEGNYDDMMESFETTTTSTQILTTTEATTMEATTAVPTTTDQRLRLDRRRQPAGGLPGPFTPREVIDLGLQPAIVDMGDDDELFDEMFDERRPVNLGNTASNQARGFGLYGSCLTCEGETPAACKSRNSITTCVGEDNVCLVQIRSRSSTVDPQIFSRCMQLNACLNHEAQNFQGNDPRFYQCRANVADRWVRSSACSMCHKLGKSTGTQLLFNNAAGDIETGDGTTITHTSLTTMMADPRTYFDSAKTSTYIYGQQSWYV